MLLYMWVFSIDNRSFIFLDFRGVFNVLGKTLHACIYIAATCVIRNLGTLMSCFEAIVQSNLADYRKREENRRNSISVNGSSSLESDTKKPTIT